MSNKKTISDLDDTEFMEKMGEALDQLVAEGKIPNDAFTGDFDLDPYILDMYLRAQENYNKEQKEEN